MKVNVKKLHPDAKLPTYATDGSGAFDMYATDDGWVGKHQGKTGLAFEVPEGHVMLVFSRSGHGYKNNVRLVNCVGIIDSDYRGEVSAKLIQDYKDEQPSAYINKGDRIAQALIVPVDRVEFNLVGELSDTLRGTGGFGSTGK